jgi:hypothetical protein
MPDPVATHQMILDAAGTAAAALNLQLSDGTAPKILYRFALTADVLEGIEKPSVVYSGAGILTPTPASLIGTNLHDAIGFPVIFRVIGEGDPNNADQGPRFYWWAERIRKGMRNQSLILADNQEWWLILQPGPVIEDELLAETGILSMPIIFSAEGREPRG